MPLKVIGAGYPRTGTMSLELALEHLGFGPCHHMAEVLQHPRQATLWARAFSGEPIDWDEVLAGYSSSTDAPSCFVSLELAQRYPDAKVVLSLRSAESWWDSAQATVMSEANRDGMIRSPNAALIGPMMMKMREYLYRNGDGAEGARAAPEPGTPDRAAAIAAFNRHNERIRAAIAPERLLVFEARQGWEPLCEFLGVPVPQQPYPRANRREEFHEMVARIHAGADVGR